MTDITASILLFIGLFGMTVILRRKISLLLEFSPRGERIHVRALMAKAAEKVAGSERIKALSPEKTLHKALSKTRILALKTENKTGSWLEQIRARSREKKENLSDDYWKQLKKRK